VRFLDVSEEINIRVLPGSCGEIACFVSVAAAGASHTVPWHLAPLEPLAGPGQRVYLDIGDTKGLWSMST
jgi:hypothetical protein